MKLMFVDTEKERTNYTPSTKAPVYKTKKLKKKIHEGEWKQ